MPFLREVTGQSTAQVGVQLTDLGITRYDPNRNCIIAVYGDTFDGRWGEDWRSPVILCHDTELNCIGYPGPNNTITAYGRAPQALTYEHNNGRFSTILPCDIIYLNGCWYLAAMPTAGLGNEQQTWFWKSRNLIDWEDAGVGFDHPAADSHTTMLSFDQFGEWVYVAGTHGLRRDGNVKLWRCRADTFPKGTWEPRNGGEPILYGKHGELCLREVDGNAVLAFFDAARYCVAAICVASPDDPWLQGNRVTVVAGQELPQLYGGYILPGSTLDTPNGVKFSVSQWVTSDNSKYHVLAYSATLPSKAAKPSYSTEMELSENGWPGLPVSADMLEWVRVPGCTPKVTVQVAKGAPSIILKAFVADWNAYIEPVDDGTTGGFRAQDSVHNSNHRSGTAVDVNHTKHPFQVSNAGFDQQQIGTMKELLAFYEGTVFWGQVWGEEGIGPFDAMHIQMGGDTYNSSKTGDFIKRKIRSDGFSTFRRGKLLADVPDATLVSERKPVEKKLNWNKGITGQETGWSCGPATTQILLSARGIAVSEQELIRMIGTHQGGTDHISQIELRALDKYLPEANYTTVDLPNDPPTQQQIDDFWVRLKAGIDNGYGLAMNWVSPPSNPPRPVNGSTSVPGFYGRSTVYHYVSAVGYAENGADKFTLVGDPGGSPHEYWVTTRQCVGLMTPKGYVWPAAFKPAPAVQPPAPQPQPPAPQPQPQPVAVAAPASDMATEWSAFLGEPDAVLAVLRNAISSDERVRARAALVLRHVPREILQAVIVRLGAGS